MCFGDQTIAEQDDDAVNPGDDQTKEHNAAIELLEQCNAALAELEETATLQAEEDRSGKLQSRSLPNIMNAVDRRGAMSKIIVCLHTIYPAIGLRLLSSVLRLIFRRCVQIGASQHLKPPLNASILRSQLKNGGLVSKK